MSSAAHTADVSFVYWRARIGMHTAQVAMLADIRTDQEDSCETGMTEPQR